MGPQIGGRYRQVVAIWRWSLAQVLLYTEALNAGMSNSNYLTGRTKSLKGIGDLQWAAGLEKMNFLIYFKPDFNVSGDKT